jgi:hypothetical protein
MMVRGLVEYLTGTMIGSDRYWSSLLRLLAAVNIMTRRTLRLFHVVDLQMPPHVVERQIAFQAEDQN